MVWMAGGTSFTKRAGTASGTAPFDANPEDVVLAYANGWTALPQSQFPALLDVPDFGAPVNTVGAMNSFKVFQTALPMIMAPTGTMGNNGAITLGTALPTNYMNGSCYLYLPAGAIAAGSAAGWYYTVMTSTTAGTVYNNAYTSGLPFVPGAAVLTPFVTTGPGAYTGATTAQAALTWTLPANQMGANGNLEVGMIIGYNPSTNNKTVTLKAGASTLFSLVEATTGVTGYQAFIEWNNQGQTGKQIVASLGTTGAVTTANTYTAIDTTQNVTMTVNITNATATDWTAIDSFSAVITPG